MIDLSLSASLRALGALLFLALGSGCSDLRNCADDNPNVIPVDTDKATRDTTAVTYQSAPSWDLDPFNAKTRYRFFHELGVTPLVVKAYLSFEKTGTGAPADPPKNENVPGSIAESAGNQALITCKDAHVIEVHNDTCQDFFIYLVAADAVPTNDGSGGAGGASDSPDTDPHCGE